MIFNCETLKKFYRGDYLQYSHILPNALFCVLSVLLEITSIKNSYRKKAKMTTEVFNSKGNVKCNEVAGAMYAFPCKDNTSKASYRGSQGIMSCFQP